MTEKITEKITMSNRANARKLANDLIIAFTWEYTKDGRAFWLEVRDRLERIAKEGE